MDRVVVKVGKTVGSVGAGLVGMVAGLVGIAGQVVGSVGRHYLEPVLVERLLGDDLTAVEQDDPHASLAHRMLDAIFFDPQERHYWLMAAPGELAAVMVVRKPPSRISVRWMASTISGTAVRVYDRGLLLEFPDGSMVGIRMRPWSAARVYNMVRHL